MRLGREDGTLVRSSRGMMERMDESWASKYSQQTGPCVEMAFGALEPTTGFSDDEILDMWMQWVI